MGFAGLLAPALLGAAGSFLDAKSANKAKNRTSTGYEDITTERTPWGPSEWDRLNILEHAGKIRHPMPWDVKGRNYGPSGEIQGMGQDLWNQAQAPGQYQGSLDEFLAGTLSGQDQNPYREELWGKLSGYRGPQELQGFMNQLGNWNAYSAYDDPSLGLPGGGGGQYGTAYQPQYETQTRELTMDDLQNHPRYAAMLAEGKSPEFVMGRAQNFLSQNPDSPLAQSLQSQVQVPQQGQTQQARQTGPYGSGGGGGTAPLSFFGGQFSQGSNRGQGNAATPFGSAGLSGDIGDYLSQILQGQGPYQGAIDQLIETGGVQDPRFMGQLEEMINAGPQQNPFLDRLQEIGSGSMLGEDDPRVQAMIERQQQQLQDRFLQDVLPGLSEQAEAFGRFRGGEQAKAAAMGDLADALGGIGVDIGYRNYQDRMTDMMNALQMGSQGHATQQAQFQSLLGMGLSADQALQALRQQGQLSGIGAGMDAHMGALGLGSQRDLAAMQDATAREQIRASSQASARSAGAAAASAAANREFAAEQNARDRALQQRLADQGFMMDAMGMLGSGEQFGLSGMGNLAGGFSGDQMGALDIAAGLNNQPFGNMLDAFGANFGIDQMRQQGAGMGYQQDLDRFRYQSAAPMDLLQQQSQIVELLTGGYGQDHRYGQTSNVAPPTASPWGSALQGGLGVMGMMGAFG